MEKKQIEFEKKKKKTRDRLLCFSPPQNVNLKETTGKTTTFIISM